MILLVQKHFTDAFALFCRVQGKRGATVVEISGGTAGFRCLQSGNDALSCEVYKAAIAGILVLPQVAEVEDGVEDQGVGADGFAAIDGIVGEQQHVALAEASLDDGGTLGYRFAVFEQAR